jgi:hypothetical protein
MSREPAGFSNIVRLDDAEVVDHLNMQEAEELLLFDPESMAVASSMFDSWLAGDFYKKQEESGFAIKYIN